MIFQHLTTNDSMQRPYKCSYPECTKSYTNSSHLKRHLETHNPTKKLYKFVYIDIHFNWSYKRYINVTVSISDVQNVQWQSATSTI